MVSKGVAINIPNDREDGSAPDGACHDPEATIDTPLPNSTSTPDAELDALCGQQLGAFAVDCVIGTGGMGKVYSARVTSKAPGVEVGSRVALKVVHPHLLETPGFFKRFMREADIGKTVEHSNVVRTYDCDQLIVDGTHQNFLVMEYVEGQTLRELQQELERVPEELCRHIAQEVAQGLVAIHAAKVIHRDIKPENVLITPEHEIKVMDLGIARLQDEAMRLSQTGHFVGSLQYAAPEQFSDTDSGVTASTDLHALGVLLYEIACGQCPYTGDDMKQLIHQITSVEPRRMSDLNPQLSPFFEEVVHTLLAKSPAARFASAEVLLEVLEAGMESEWWHQRVLALRAETEQPLRRIRIPRDTAVYRRDDELAQLRKLYERAAAGDGQVLLVEGEAGIGKSRLIDEFVGQLRRAGEDINFLFGSYPPGGAATSLGAFSTAYREQMGSRGSTELLPTTPLLAPAFDALLRGDTAPIDCVPLTKDSLQTCFVHATRELAKQRTTVVLIDDLHFAPEEGRALFASLALGVPDYAVLLIGTLRPGQVSEEWIAGVQRIDHVSRLPVQRLGARDLVKLLEDTFRSKRLAEELGVKIALKSDGNPFFVFEILRGLREGQFITQQPDGTWVSTQFIEEIEIPSTVLDLVNARVADLTEEERDLLDVACCRGYEFDPDLIGDVLGLARIPLLKRFAQIERAHRLVRSAGEGYVFDHHQVQEALYGSLHPKMREEYHAALAKALESRTKAADRAPETLDGALCVDLCEHYLKGVRGENALRYLESAQTHLTNGYLHAQMVALTERALVAPDLLTGIERAKTLLRLARTLNLMGGRRSREEKCVRNAERLAEEADDDTLRGQAALALGRFFFQTSRYEQAEAAIRRALEIAQAIGDQRAEVRMTGHLGLVFWAKGRLPEARQHFERTLALSREIQDRSGEAGATAHLGDVFMAEGRLPEAREQLEQALALNREIGDRHLEALATGNLGNVFSNQGSLSEAREHFERDLALTRETGIRGGEAVALANLGALWLRLGNPEHTRTALDASVTICREIGDRYPEGYGLLDLGRLAAEEGDIQEATRLVEESLALRREIGHGDGVVDSLLELAELRFGAGDSDSASDMLHEALELAERQGRAEVAALARAHLARLPGGDVETAVQAIESADESKFATEIRWLLWQATDDRVHLEKAKRLLDEQLAKVPSEYHEAMCTNIRLHRDILVEWQEHGEAE